MKAMLYSLPFLVLFWLAPCVLRADCVSLSGYTSWVPESDKRIVFYRRSVPIAAVKLQNCKVHPDSDIRLIKAYVCGNDRIVIDNDECWIFSLDSLTR